MYKRGIFRVLSNEQLTATVWRMVLEGDTQYIVRPGQFVNIELQGRFLRRPISVCDWEDGRLTLIYKVVGDGTADMSRMTAGTQLDLLTGLGNGFTVDAGAKRPLLVGGGVGVPPLYGLAKRLVAGGVRPTAVLGFNTADEIFCADEFRAAGADVIIATADGSAGVKGFVTDAMKGLSYDYFYACGPMPMLRALCKATDCNGELSLEERMGCGFGACMGCSCKMPDGGYKRVCKEGPVFRRNELMIND